MAPLPFPDIETKTTLSPYPQSVSAARRFVRDVLMSRHVSDQVVHVVELLTSEVVTNAIVHARSATQLAVEVNDGSVRVAVRDDSGRSPVRHLHSVDDESGRGVVIIDQLASAWGVEQERNGGKRVWFEVAC